MQAMQVGTRAATDALRKKSISLAQSHYGSLSYILAYTASGFHLINKNGQVRLSDLHCVCPMIVQAFCQAERNLWLWHWSMSNHCLVLPVTHFCSNQRYACSCVLDPQWAHHGAARSKPDFVIVKAALQQSALHMFACCVGAQS